MASRRSKKPKKEAKPKLSTEERKKRAIKRRFITDINTTFTNASCQRIPTTNVKLVLKDEMGIDRDLELDSVFVFENIIVVLEDTTERSMSDHLRKKDYAFCLIKLRPTEFINWLQKFKKFRDNNTQGYGVSNFRVVFAYCSLYPVSKSDQSRYPDIAFIDGGQLKYFLSLTKTIKKTARFELFKLFGIKSGDIGFPRPGGTPYFPYNGLLLPVSPSGYPHSIVSFLIEPQQLLEMSYVLRKDSCHDSSCLYQRILIRSKIEEMRKNLAAQKRVFINNIIVTLPPTTRLLEYDQKTKKYVDAKESDESKPIKIEVPNELNSIGIIDGQHRIFAYYEGSDKLDAEIGKLRKRQHLLVTGMRYPGDFDEAQKGAFEAKLFLEINDKQKRVKAALRQDIEVLVNPFSEIAMARAVVMRLAESGSLAGYLEKGFFDSGPRIKTASLTKFGIVPLVRTDGTDSLFIAWRDKEKRKLINGKDSAVLARYIDYCAEQMNLFVGGFASNISSSMWVADRKKSRALSVTTITALAICLRKLVKDNKLGDFDYYKEKLSNLNIDFSPEVKEDVSSHWTGLAERIYDQCFKS